MANADIVLGSNNLTPEEEWLFAKPWLWLISALALTTIALAMAQLLGEALTSIRVVLVFVGVFAALAAIVVRPASPAVLAAAALTAFIGSWALYVGGRDKDWNSIRLVLAVAAFAAIVAAGIVALPRLWRRVAVSAIILLHFGGILTAVLTASPGPWLANVMWVSVYRPYLQLMYLINAYHFYAPNPGPSYYFWFRVAYTRDGDAKIAYWEWIKVPDMKQDGWPNYPLALQYQRHLSLATLVAQNTQPVGYPQLSEINRRHEAANLERYKAGKPIFPVDSSRPSYARPTETGAALLQSYVRHVARMFSRSHPDVAITGIKVYRLEHLILDAPELARGDEPGDPHTYLPYYWGAFDTAGNLTAPDDPFLYWHMPFLRVKPEKPAFFASNVDILKPLAEHLRDYLKKYLKDEAATMPHLPQDAAKDTGAVEDFNRLLESPVVSAMELKGFEGKHPGLAGKTRELLEENRRKKTTLADIESRVTRKYEILPEDVRLLALLEDINFLLRRHPGLITDLIRHAKARAEEGKEAEQEKNDLARILEFWASGRFRLPRDDEDHFDIAVATAKNVPDRDPMILNYAYFHAGDPEWVRYPGHSEWQELRP